MKNLNLSENERIVKNMHPMREISLYPAVSASGHIVISMGQVE